MTRDGDSERPAPPPESTDAPPAGPSRTGSSDDRSDLTLQTKVVSYPDRPDRCTIYKPGLEDVSHMSTWISADRSAFVDLATSR